MIESELFTLIDLDQVEGWRVDDAFDTNIPSETTEYIRTVEDLMELIPQYPASASEEKPVRWRSGF